MTGPYLSLSGTDEPQHGRAWRAKRHSRCQRSIGMPVTALLRRREHDSEVVLETAGVTVSHYYLSSSTQCRYVPSLFCLFTFPPHLSSGIVSIKHFTRHVYNISHSGLSSVAMHEPILLLSLVRQKMAESNELLHGIERAKAAYNLADGVS